MWSQYTEAARTALYIAGIMYLSMVGTALISIAIAALVLGLGLEIVEAL